MRLLWTSAMLLGCANRSPGTSALRSPSTQAQAPSVRAPRATRLEALPVTPVTPQLPRVTTADFSLTIPEGYDDVSARFANGLIVVALAARQSSLGYQPTIIVIKAPIPGGTYAEPFTCSQTGRGFINGGTESPGTGGTLKSAEIINGPVGKACQIHIVTPEAVSLTTELDLPHNTPFTPKDVWLLVCNHADGDQRAETNCRTALAGFRFRNRDDGGVANRRAENPGDLWHSFESASFVAFLVSLIYQGLLP